VKIDEIHLKAAEDARRLQQQQQQQHQQQQQFIHGKSGSYVSNNHPQQIQHQQHQQPQHQQHQPQQQHPQILARGSNLPRGKLNSTFPPRGSVPARGIKQQLPPPHQQLQQQHQPQQQQQLEHQATKSTTSIVESSRLVESLVEEYLRNSKFETEILLECPVEAVKAFITKVIQIYVETIKAGHRELLLRLLDELGSHLVSARALVFEAISQLEGLANLPDYVLDHRQVAESVNLHDM
jgi:hypothetical protein